MQLFSRRTDTRLQQQSSTRLGAGGRHSDKQLVTGFVKKTHLPEALELPLLDAEQLAGLPADDGGVARRVVQDGLPERRADPQRADGDCILYTDTPERVVENGRK